MCVCVYKSYPEILYIDLSDTTVTSIAMTTFDIGLDVFDITAQSTYQYKSAFMLPVRVVLRRQTNKQTNKESRGGRVDINRTHVQHTSV